MKGISESTKKIVSVEIPNWRSFAVGTDGVTRILSYNENGEMAHVPWLAVLRENHVWIRLPARMCVIEYAPDGEEEVSKTWR